MAQPQGTTSVNIAILDKRDFPADLAPTEELFSEFAMTDGRVLFECPGLIKVTGIDLMNCPLNVMLKLRIRRRMPQGAAVLWHVLLPLPLISKYFLSPPHEWETWIGLFPNTQSLEAHTPDTMFTQAVHLINRPEFPKLRLRFTYDNAELRKQYEVETARQEVVKKQRDEVLSQQGKSSFESTNSLFRNLRGDSGQSAVGSGAVGSSAAVQAAPYSAGSSAAVAAAAPTAPAAVQVVLPAAQGAPYGGTSSAAAPDASGGGERQALLKALAFVNEVGYALSQSVPPLPLPPPLKSEVPAAIEQHCRELRACLATKCAEGGAAGAAVDTESEQVLSEGLRMALMGMLDDSDRGGGGMPRTSTNLSVSTNTGLELLKSRFPRIWDACREVSALAKERASLMEQLGSVSSSKPSNFDDLLRQQREAQQRAFEGDLEALRRQRDEARSAVQDREVEIGKLRLQLDQLMRQQGVSGFPN